MGEGVSPSGQPVKEQLKVALAEANSKYCAKKAALEKAVGRLDALQSELQRHLPAVGLKAGLSAGSFANWVQKAETAQSASGIGRWPTGALMLYLELRAWRLKASERLRYVQA